MGQPGFIFHPSFLRHDTGESHPECAQRLMAIESALKKSGLYDELVHLGLSEGHRLDLGKWIELVHRPAHVERVRTSIPASGQVHVDPDTVVSPYSFEAAQFAVEGVLTAVDQVMEGKLANAFCAVRPPGHHAESNRSMGFCLFNNVAIAARYLQERYGLERVAIVDWDVHHGNGTQQIFYEDPSVFYFSVHQFPLYPGTGGKDEVGADQGKGFTLNCPLSSGGGDAEYRRVMDEVLAPALKSFDPEFILISAGFDAHENDPLAGMRVSTEGFAELTRQVKKQAEALCEGRLVSCLEGGYHLESLGQSVQAHLLALGEDS